MSQERHEYRVVYRRYGWSSTQARVYQSLSPALRYAHRLGYDDYPSLSALEFVYIECRTVGEWSKIPERYLT